MQVSDMILNFTSTSRQTFSSVTISAVLIGKTNSWSIHCTAETVFIQHLVQDNFIRQKNHN